MKNNHADLYFEIYGVRVDGAGATVDEPKGETDAAAEEGKEGKEWIVLFVGGIGYVIPQLL